MRGSRLRQAVSRYPALPVFLLLAATLASGTAAARDCAPDAVARFVSEHYGDSIEFDVLRNGKTVGEHITRFSSTGAGLEVESNMNLGVSVLFIPVYRFEYVSRSQWCDGRLQELTATVNDGGETTRVTARAADGGVVVGRGNAAVVAPGDIVPTDHWLARAVEQDTLLNTITGRLNHVAVGSCATPSPLVAARAPVGARCFEYSGDLSARVWYDSAGRWVGLEFAGRDGSSIVYACRRCGRGI